VVNINREEWPSMTGSGLKCLPWREVPATSEDATDAEATHVRHCYRLESRSLHVSGGDGLTDEAKQEYDQFTGKAIPDDARTLKDDLVFSQKQRITVCHLQGR
jgi:hypothetical protein